MGTFSKFTALVVGVLLSCKSWTADSDSGAYGARLNLQANVQVIGLGVGAATLAQTPNVNASGGSSYGPVSQTVLGTQVGLLGTTVLSAGVLSGQTQYNSITPLTTSSGRADGVAVNLQITPLLPLLGLTADSIEANARISGVCGALTASGDSQLVGARVTALGGGLLNLPVSPPPNFTVDLGVLGITGVTLVLNEQIVSGNPNSRSITVNALHLDVSANALLASLTGDIIIGSARAQRSCAAGDGPNLVGAKSANPNPATVGQPLVFTISAQNIGNQTASNVVLVDSLNPAFAITSATAGAGGNCGVAAQVVTCTFASLAPGQTASASINVIPGQAGTFSNGLNTGFDGPDVDPGDDDPTIEIIVQPAPIVADVDVQLSANPNPASVGTDLFVLVTVRNNGPDTSDINLSHVLNGSLTVQAVLPTGNGSCNGTTTLSCTWAAVPAAGSQSVNIRVLPAAIGTIGATATLSVPTGITDPNPANNTATLDIPVQAAATVADLSVVKTANPVPATVGQPLTFTLTVSNAGPDAAGASVTDVLAASLSLQSVSASNGGGCSGSSTVVCTWASIPAGATRTVTIVTIPTQVGTVSNSATVTSTTGSTDPDPGDDSSTILVPVNPSAIADLSVVKTANPNPATVGEPLTFTLTVGNAGPDASGASVSDLLPAGVNLQSSTASDGGQCSGAATVVCSWTSIPAGQTRSASIVVIPTVSGTLSNTAVTAPTGGATDPDPGDDSSTILVPVNPAAVQADLGVTMSATPNPATVGEDLVYTLTVSNAGPGASAARLTDALPASLVLQSALAGGSGSCAGVTTVVCNWSAIPAGQTRVATITVRPSAAGAVGNSANVESTDGSVDPNPANNSASTQVQVNASGQPPTADLAVTQSANPQPAIAGQPMSLSLTVSNAGPDAAGASLNDLIDSNFNVVAVNASGGGTCTTVNALSCSWASIPANGSVSVLVSLLPTAAGTFANTAAVSIAAGVTDPDSSNNSSTQNLQVNPATAPSPSADLSVVVRALPEAVTIGQTLVLQVEVRNAGPDAAAASLSQSLDPGLTLVDLVSPTGVTCNGSLQISCAISALSSGASSTVQLTVRANRSGAITHQASVNAVSPAVDPDLSNNSGSAAITATAATTPANADLSVIKQAFPMDPVIGAPVNYLVTLHNHGPDAAAGPIVMTDELPANLVAESVSARGGGSCTLSASLVRCTWDGLASNASVTASVLARANVTGPVRNVVTITHPNIDGDPTNDSAEITVDVRSLAGLRSDGGMCKVTRKLTDHDSTSHFANAKIRYGGADVIYADDLAGSAGTFTESLLAGSQKATLVSQSGSDTQLLVASRHGAKAVVRSGKNLADNGTALDAPAVFLLNLQNQSALRLPDELTESSLLALNGVGEELYYFVAVGANETALKLYKPADRSTQTLQSYPAAAGLFNELKVSHNGWQVAFTAQINPLGQNNDGSMEVFRFDADSGITTQVTAGVGNAQLLGGFDGAGEHLTWIEGGQVFVHDPVNGSRQLTTDGHDKRTALLTHNGRKVAYLANAGQTAGSFELMTVDVAGGQPQLLTQLNLAGSEDRLLSHDGSGQTFLLASKRQLFGPTGDDQEHLYVIDCDAIRSGAWFNPARSGQGYAIQRSQDGLAVLWYTYRADGTPTWYIASGPRQGKSWQADLLDVRYNAVDGSRTLTTVGKLALTFGDSHNAIAHWTLNGITRFEPIQFLEFDRRPPARDETGVWFDPNNPGWGMSLSHQGQTRFMLTYLYDTAGQPLWIEGQTNLDAVQTPARLYFGPGLCSSTCGETGPAPVGRSVGQFNVEVLDYGQLDISTDYRSEGSQPIQWLRANRRFEPLTPLSP